jgi:hypothetical protein
LAQVVVTKNPRGFVVAILLILECRLSDLETMATFHGLSKQGDGQPEKSSIGKRERIGRLGHSTE